MKITIYHNVAHECRYCGVPVTRAPEPLQYEGWVDPSRRGWPTSPAPPKTRRGACRRH
ncbi:MAG TPA: hypothetical protein VE733_20570 [Streptosporangiaceae bacterium]|nr:hypothetical protein [Streptosporangiaceae bacterium]